MAPPLIRTLNPAPPQVRATLTFRTEDRDTRVIVRGHPCFYRMMTLMATDQRLFLENVGQCDGDIQDYILIYEVKNYEWQTSGMNGAGWVLKMYNEQGLQHEKHQPSGVSSSTVWHMVFTMILKTGKVCDGWVDFLQVATC